MIRTRDDDLIEAFPDHTRKFLRKTKREEILRRKSDVEGLVKFKVDELSIDKDKRTIEQLVKRASMVQMVVDAIKEAIKPVKFAIPKKIDTGNKRGDEEEAVLLISDPQIGKVTRSYNSDVFAEKLSILTEKTIKITNIQRTDHPVKKLNIFFLGDVVDGESIYPTQAHHIDQSVVNQIYRTGMPAFRESLIKLAYEFEEIEIDCVPGNHGRTGKFNDELSNWDIVFYESLKLLTDGIKNIKWNIAYDWKLFVEIFDTIFLLTHGNSIKMYLNIPHYGITTKGMRWQGSLGKFHYMCLDNETEILTTDGWKGIDRIKKGDGVLTLNPHSGLIENDTATKIIKYIYTGEMYHWKTSKTDIMVTPDHRMYFLPVNIQNRDKYPMRLSNKWDKDGLFYVAPACDMAKRSYVRIPRGSLYPITKPYNVNIQMLKLIAWVITEGHFQKGRKQKPYAIKIGQKEGEKAVEIRRILNALKITFSEYKSKDNMICFYINAKYAKKIFKLLPIKEELPEWICLLSTRQFKTFWKELIKGDGYTNKRSRYCSTETLVSVNKNFIGNLQAIMVRHGWLSRVYSRKGGYKNSITYCLEVAHRRNPIMVKKPYIIKYDNYVWCISTKNKTIVIRRNGCVSVVGNCLGHFHTSAMNDWNEWEAIINGTFVSDDNFTEEILGLKSQTKQILFYVHPKNKITARYKIDL